MVFLTCIQFVFIILGVSSGVSSSYSEKHLKSNQANGLLPTTGKKDSALAANGLKN